MNKGSSIAALGIIAALSTASVLANDGTINFTGEILDASCTIDIGANNTMTVEMGKVGKTSFTGVGSVSDATKFVLKLKDCPDTVTTAAIKFDGIAYNGDDSVLALTDETGVATGVGIQLSDSSLQVLPLFTPSAAITLVAGDNSIPFYARYIQEADTVTAGPANSVTQFTVMYN